MKKLIFAATFSVAAFLAYEASAVTVLDTTQKSVKEQCAGKTSCTTACGSTLCDYVCDDPKKQCTATVFLKKRPIKGVTGKTAPTEKVQ